jgi:hypothetical protein
MTAERVDEVSYGRGVPAVVLGFTHVNRGTLDAQSDDAAKAARSRF